MRPVAEAQKHRSRWLDWKPSSWISSEKLQGEPSKPTEPGFDGSVGSSQRLSGKDNGDSIRASEESFRDTPRALNPPWPKECIDSQRRFGTSHARLFPLVGCRVSTPSGPGLLLQVCTGRAEVILEAGTIVVDPDEVLPLGIANQPGPVALPFRQVVEETQPDKPSIQAAEAETGVPATGKDDSSQISNAQGGERCDQRVPESQEHSGDRSNSSSVQEPAGIASEQQACASPARNVDEDMPAWRRELSRRLKEIKQRREAEASSTAAAQAAPGQPRPEAQPHTPPVAMAPFVRKDPDRNEGKKPGSDGGIFAADDRQSAKGRTGRAHGSKT
jgi:hypothetical protein